MIACSRSRAGVCYSYPMSLQGVASAVAPGEVVHVRLAAGELLCEVQKTADELIRKPGGV